MKYIFTVLFLAISLNCFSQQTLNVATYGAIGNWHSVNDFVTTSNSQSISSATAIFAAKDLSNVVEVFNAGIYHSGTTSNETLVAIITNVVNSTTVQVNQLVQHTGTGQYGTIFTNNQAAFKACLNDATNSGICTVQIPTGSYGFVDSNFVYYVGTAFDSIDIYRGNLTFQGIGGQATLVQNGGWHDISNIGKRGRLFVINGVTNGVSAALTYSNITFDGGIQNGFTANNFSAPADPNTGEGVDTSHDAIDNEGNINFVMPSVNTANGCIWQHWRGEMIKDNTGNLALNMFWAMTNCAGWDGNLTWINNYAVKLDTCTSSNIFQVCEQDTGQKTNDSFYVNCKFLNVGTGIAFVGNRTNSIKTQILLSNNIIKFTTTGISLANVANPNIISNLFDGSNLGGVAINETGAGTQPSDGTQAINANMTIYGNTLTNTSGISLGQYSGFFYISNNIAYLNGGQSTFLYAGNGGGGGNAFSGTNCYVGGNASPDSNMYIDVSGISSAGQYPHMSNNSLGYYHGQGDGFYGLPQYGVSYAYGDNHRIINLNLGGGSTNMFLQVDSKIPSGSTMTVANSGTDTGNPMTIYLSQAFTGAPVSISVGTPKTFYFFNGAWGTSPPVVPVVLFMFAH